MSDLLISFYGDDLTGSTDAMEALNLASLRTALFLKPATEAQIQKLSAAGPLQAIGLAGTSRSETPEWMQDHLPTAFAWLKRQGAAICHYKVCSTFDSAPHVGNIGCALEIGARVFEQNVVPIVVGVPQLRRYTVFGHLFASVNGVTYRIDRHPVMSRHPVTPMHEADLRLHLAQQTQVPIDLLDGLRLQEADVDAAMDQAMQTPGSEPTPGVRGLLLDVPDRAGQAIVGRQLWRSASTGTGVFTVGSSGVEYALVQAWREARLLPVAAKAPDAVNAVGQMAVVSGSCSEITAQQIRHASEQGFVPIHASAARLASRSQGDAEQQRVLVLAKQALDDGHSVIVYTAMGLGALEAPPVDAQPHAVGQRLGRLLRDVVIHGRLKRAVVAGGDTSSHALQELEVFALTVAMALPRTPGSPLCTAHSALSGFDGLQLAFKGGQIGAPDYFSAIRDGRG